MCRRWLVADRWWWWKNHRLARYFREFLREEHLEIVRTHLGSCADCTAADAEARIKLQCYSRTVGPVGWASCEPGQSLTAAAISSGIHADASLTVLGSIEKGFVLAKKSTAKIIANETARETPSDAPLPQSPPVDGAMSDMMFADAGANASSSTPGYTVLARRYRSKQFDELIGQESISRTLQNAIAMNRIAHAYLFCGTRGVGKTSMARVLARALNAPKELTQASAIASSIFRGEDMDVIEIDGASNRGVDDARDLISKAGILPARSPYKIYIIDEVHMLTTPAFNALLKTMEEPPPHVKFILCTTEPHKVPATIQSRCQRFDFKPIATSRIAAHLRDVITKEGLQADDDAIHLVAKLGNGSMRDALSLLDRLIAAASGNISSAMAQEVLGLPDAGLVAAVTTAVSNGDAKAGLESAAELLESGCPVEQALEFFAARWRDFLVLRTCGKETDLVDLSPEAKLIAASQAQNFEPHELVHFVAVCEAAIRAIRSSGSSRTIFDATIARLCLHREFVRIEIAASHSTLTGDAEKKNVSSSPRPATLISATSAPATTPATLPTPMREAFTTQGQAARIQAPTIQAPTIQATSIPHSNASHASAPTPGLNATHLHDMTAVQAWSKIAAAATSTPEKVLAESFVPVSLNNKQLTLRAAENAGGAANYAARKSEMLQTLVARALGPGWKLHFETPAQAPEQTIAPMHGLDKELMQIPMIQHAMDAFDAIVVKVEQSGSSQPRIDSILAQSVDSTSSDSSNA
ncbi:MAG: DNA polymerase III subunit gamma/tau [Planctomycetota bacterium]|nr:MAG: DNA polymerase III subunit gamma/tau [Planctomycetota bacterium]